MNGVTCMDGSESVSEITTVGGVISRHDVRSIDGTKVDVRMMSWRRLIGNGNAALRLR